MILCTQLTSVTLTVTMTSVVKEVEIEKLKRSKVCFTSESTDVLYNMSRGTWSEGDFYTILLLLFLCIMKSCLKRPFFFPF